MSQSLHKPRAVIYPWKGWYDILCDELCWWWRRWWRNRDMAEHYRQGRVVACKWPSHFSRFWRRNTTIVHYTPLPLEAKHTQHTHRGLFGWPMYSKQFWVGVTGQGRSNYSCSPLCMDWFLLYVWIGHFVGGWVVQMEREKSTVNCQTVTAVIHHLWKPSRSSRQTDSQSGSNSNFQLISFQLLATLHPATVDSFSSRHMLQVIDFLSLLVPCCGNDNKNSSPWLSPEEAPSQHIG